jgi:hypothetical protein
MVLSLAVVVSKDVGKENRPSTAPIPRGAALPGPD